MASCYSSIIGVSSIYQTPSSELPRRVTAVPALSLTFSAEKSHFNGLKASAANFQPKQLVGCGVTGGPLSVATAVASPNFLLLREEAFKRLEGFGNSDSEYESEADELESSSGAASSVDELSVSYLGLPKRLVDSLANRGITELFPIQRAVLVPALEGRDIIARAKTSTGKTLAFGIPVLKRLSEDERSSLRQGRLPRMLVLAPTRELASQVDKELKESVPYLSTICVYGGVCMFSPCL